ncbi:hypothetical protein VTJ83DRAFT_4898 [Remersonia thermophila]|uniref:Zn(2)-C6 fungal-type domain-containing protein n=1 Tax=Remersonia thermophila TaxID=72144 RepID=A0ABR4DCR7_9PEZI
MSGLEAPRGPLHPSAQDVAGYSAHADPGPPPSSQPSTKKKSRRGDDPSNQKRRCVSTACIACRKRKSKCDGAEPSCAACASVYGTECVYDPNSDHRRKGVYREKTDSMKARSSTLQILIEAILNAAEEDVPAIVKKIRTCDSLDAVAESILKNEGAGDGEIPGGGAGDDDDAGLAADQPLEGEQELARKMGELRLENGSVRYIGGTSHLIYTEGNAVVSSAAAAAEELEPEDHALLEDPITSWTGVTKDKQLIAHLMNMYFNWHYPYFVTLSKSLFFRDYLRGKPRRVRPSTTLFCSSLLVNAMLALGCHFTSVPGAFAVPGDSRTKGDHFFAEAKRLIVENDEYAKPRLTTVQALALMSVREAGCGREANGWVYSGMSFRMAQDIGINLHLGGVARDKDPLDEQEVDARRVTFWGCFLFDKCWSNYLGRLPQLPKNTYNVPKYDVFPDEDAAPWSPYTDSGFDRALEQPSRIRAAGLHLSKLCEISSDLLLFFYHPNHINRSTGKSIELKKLSELHRRLEDWKKELPAEFDPKDGQLPHVILMHMFFHLQYIHLFKAFLKYTPETSPLPAHVSPWRVCGANAGAISKLMRLYKKMYNLRQICNIAVYMVQTACTIHILNLPEKTARRDIIHGVKHLEEIAEDWLCARRALSTLSVLSRKWNIELPEEAALVLQRTDEKYGTVNIADVPSPQRPASSSAAAAAAASCSPPPPPPQPYLVSPSAGGESIYPYASAPQPMSIDMPTTATSSDLASSMAASGAPPAVQGMNSGASSQAQSPAHLQQQSIATTSAPVVVLTDPGTGITPWAISPATRTMPSFMQAYAPLHAQAHTPAVTTAQTPSPAPPPPPPLVGGPLHRHHHQHQHQTPQAAKTPSSLYAIDGQDWYLKDGVNWQQNFQAWGVGASSAASAASTPAPSNATSAGLGRALSTASSGSGTGLGDPSSMYMFRGVELGDMDGSGFEALGLVSLDHLSGLD